ncbi:Zinc finger protein 410 [Phytophthora citrophthora]|uniref:Zinc finger protein 410 n=1 Tax=Phytophthora citrophthora TaxID=4793 RepID=A0AAD9GVP4_9STRA|nr:Zinc finger protein 410 [Phytophthora citrophthora]
MQVSSTFDSTVTLKRLGSAPLPQTESPAKAQVKPLTPTPHCCTEPGCNRHFNRRYTLIEHMKTHTGEKPHVCPVRTCAKRFSTSGNLSRHKRLHGYIEPLQCPVDGCLSSFPSNNKLEKHMKFHLGSAVHVCTVNHCGKTFSTVGNLNRHMKNQHSDEVSTSSSSPSEFGALSPTSAEQQSTSSYTALLLESSMEISQPSAFDVSKLQFTPQQCEVFQVPPPKAPTTWHSDEMVDVLTEIFDESVVQSDEQPEDSEKISILDDMINFHVSHMS